ncbi:hypothetical protein J1N09_03090 [Aureitalea sp. L0-47]|uniref:DUF6090 family protein n=1 Tax=Aureitalea sp. L0-47 TaxID=2816962 RepID=UPI0022370195|nr:DUF6090 family protein [Aureitalea sp. L0-47]MCW5518807.1 hypothetical protein [Aureitalea sp. L0-47]
MIKFFRKIRQKLLSENKFSKYLIYAIGEIILVVIGILIALQINNWNEYRKERAEETKILKNIRVDLQQTLAELETALAFHESTIDEITKLENYSKNSLPYSEELDYSFGLLPHFYTALITSSSYKSLQTTGVGLIKNDSLRDDIINIYDVTLADILDYNKDEERIQSLTVMPFFSKNIRYFDNSVYSAKPNDYSSLISNEEFLNVLSIIKRTRRRGIERYNGDIVRLKEVIEKIKTELDSRIENK